MQEHIGQVLRATVEPEDLDVEHIRNPGERKPVRGVAGCEGPLEAVEGQAVADVRVLGDVDGIVEVDELEVVNLRIQAKNDGQKGRIEPEIRPRHVTIVA